MRTISFGHPRKEGKTIILDPQSKQESVQLPSSLTGVDISFLGSLQETH